jgi:hypothetical protein
LWWLKRGGTGNPTTKASVVEGAAIEEEAEIEEIFHPEGEKVALQCVRVARRQGDEWVFYEEDHSDHAIHKLQWTVEDLMG